ncbi:MAG TPA: hypothetical protein DCS93_32090 [Microscillaceae bacterium]|nr:hypothetical protein [Microscillaceae bacterium]
MDNVNQILIEKYVEGTLTAQEKAAFEQRLTKDTELAKEFAEMQDFMLAMQVFGRDALKSELKAVAEAEALPSDLFAEPTEKKTAKSDAKVRSISLRKMAGIAAVILAILVPTVLLLNNQNTSPEELYTRYFEVYPNMVAPIVRGNTTQKPLEQAMEAYEAGNYGLAIQKLQNIVVSEDKKEGAQFYLAMAHLANGDAKVAIGKFQKLQTQTLTNYQEQTQWYLAMAYLASKDIKNCKQQLQKLSSQKGFYQKKAKELLAKL